MSETPIYRELLQFVDPEPSALCTIGRPPLVMTGALLWILRRHFANVDYIQDSMLKQYVWSKDATSSQIMIEPITKWPGAPTQTTQLRPALYVKRNTYGRIKLGIGDRYMPGGKPVVDNSGELSDNALNSGSKFEVIIAGSHTVFCLGGTGAEAESIGTEVFFELLEFTPLIRRDLDLNKFQVMEMGSVSKLEESKEHWAVPVVVTYMFNHVWELKQDAPILKGVSLIV